MHDWKDDEYWEEDLSIGDEGYIVYKGEKIVKYIVREKEGRIRDCYVADFIGLGYRDSCLVFGRHTPNYNLFRMYKDYGKAKEALDSGYICLMRCGVPLGVTVEEYKKILSEIE